MSHGPKQWQGHVDIIIHYFHLQLADEVSFVCENSLFACEPRTMTISTLA